MIKFEYKGRTVEITERRKHNDVFINKTFRVSKCRKWDKDHLAARAMAMRSKPERFDESLNMGARFPKNTLFAYLGADQVPVLCTRARAYEWLREDRGLQHVGVKSDSVDGLIIYKQFQWFSSDPDLPMFWQVNWYSLSPYRSGERRFGTKEEALAFHASLVAGEQSLEQLTADGDESDEADWWKGER
jgi:hypothetical protein